VIKYGGSTPSKTKPPQTPQPLTLSEGEGVIKGGALV